MDNSNQLLLSYRVLYMIQSLLSTVTADLQLLPKPPKHLICHCSGSRQLRLEANQGGNSRSPGISTYVNSTPTCARIRSKILTSRACPTWLKMSWSLLITGMRDSPKLSDGIRLSEGLWQVAIVVLYPGVED